ncbi:UNVERIFIED_CONTAM: hypothetical protein GTU68_051259 [Idotea baltica]|nr:hypothetical protein [Idotea baltica]
MVFVIYVIMPFNLLSKETKIVIFNLLLYNQTPPKIFCYTLK